MPTAQIEGEGLFTAKVTGLQNLQRSWPVFSEVDSHGGFINYGGGIPRVDYFRNTDASTELLQGDIHLANGSIGTPVLFELKPPSGEIWEIEEISFDIEATSIDPVGYGGGLVLTNGCIFQISMQPLDGQGVPVGPLLTMDIWPAPFTFKSNLHLIRWLPADSNNIFAQGQNKLLQGVIKFRQLLGRPIMLHGDFGEKISYIVQDNMTTQGFGQHHVGAVMLVIDSTKPL